MKNTVDYGYISLRATNPLRRGERLHSWALGALLLRWAVDPPLLLVVAG
jgi:hypothetical protein